MTKRVLTLVLLIASLWVWAGAVDAQALSVLKPGAKGAEVEKLQRALAALGYAVKADGVFGSKTSAAVRRIQVASGLKQDGLVGKGTWSAIDSSLALQQMIRQGIYIVQRGDTLASIAARLKVPEASLRDENSLLSNRSLFAGQALSIPSKTQAAKPAQRPPVEPVLAVPAQRVALTFDDAPAAGNLPDILRLLNASGIRATFFLTLDTVVKYREDLAEALRLGHTIENHGGVTAGNTGIAAIAQGIEAVAAAVEQVTGRRTAFFRPISSRVAAPFADAAAMAGHRLVMWSNIGRPDDDLLLKATKDVLFDGAVLRFSLNDPSVLEILPELLNYLASHGYGAGPLDPAS